MKRRPNRGPKFQREAACGRVCVRSCLPAEDVVQCMSSRPVHSLCWSSCRGASGSPCSPTPSASSVGRCVPDDDDAPQSVGPSELPAGVGLVASPFFVPSCLRFRVDSVVDSSLRSVLSARYRHHVLIAQSRSRLHTRNVRSVVSMLPNEYAGLFHPVSFWYSVQCLHCWWSVSLVSPQAFSLLRDHLVMKRHLRPPTFSVRQHTARFPISVLYGSTVCFDAFGCDVQGHVQTTLPTDPF